MAGFVDLHCHYLPGIDDGVRTQDDGVALLRRLGAIGFERVVATPHMRPGMFDNDRAAIEACYAKMAERVAAERGLPTLGLGAEHYLDDTVFPRLLRGEGVLYPGGHGVLIELHADIFPVRLAERFFDLQRRGVRPVLAHPERYARVWSEPSVLEPLLDGGTLLLLDVAALVGKYGRKPEKAAHQLLEDGFYYAACSDAHRPSDVDAVGEGIARLTELIGEAEASFLLGEGPRSILQGTIAT